MTQEYPTSYTCALKIAGLARLPGHMEVKVEHGESLDGVSYLPMAEV